MPFEEVRVRVAPSPTGDPHVGSAYATLFNYVFAKKHGGKLILRIEDTDQTRAKASSEKQIMTCLKWLGLQWDEGPDCGGDYGPYRQSERKHLHRQYVDKLLAKGSAYRCFCSPEELTAVREEQKKEGKKTAYNRKCRDLDKSTVEKYIAAGKTFVVRMKIPMEGVTSFMDEIRGRIEIANDLLDDQVLIKSDGFPTYHLANVVDDHLMKISHVLRAEEWISSTPKHVLLYQAFGWDMPQFIHLPLLRNTDRSKISKRKNPISIDFYRRKGILPKALVNFLALMGWSYGEDREIFTLEDMIAKFEVKDINLGGPIFDLTKLTWMNQQYLQKLSENEFVGYLRSEVFSQEYLAKIFQVIAERIETFDQFFDKASYFFGPPVTVRLEDICPKTRDKDQLLQMLSGLLELLDEQYVWEMVHLQENMDQHRNKINWKPGEYLVPIRMILTGRKDSPPLSKTMEILGREISRQRLRDWIDGN
jgi:glutamyl-tRNA synthetase